MAASAKTVLVGIFLRNFMDDTVILVQDLNKQFKSRQNKNLVTGLWRPDYKTYKAVKDASFSVARGESVAFLGPNGAGKTTTTKMMTGLMYPTSGKIDVLGFEPFSRKREFLSRIGLVMGNKNGLNWDLTANQSFSLLKSIYQIDEDEFKQRVTHLTKLLSVAAKLDEQVRRLSLGERMKVELIGAILHNPEILFLDEPTIGLDIESKKSVREFLRTIQRENNTTLILTSHDMDDIEEVSDRVLVINKGQIAYDGDLEKLINKYNQNKYLRLHFKDEIDDSMLSKHGKILSTDNGVFLKVKAKEMANVLAEVTQNFEVEDINIESTPLETIISDIFAGNS